LQALEAAGLSAGAIAEKLGATRKAVIGCSQRLRGLTYTFPSYLKKERELRAATQARRRDRERRSRAAIARMKAEISKGAARDVAIAAAVKRGAKSQAIADEFGITKGRVYQISPVRRTVGKTK
jgi:hypothetical protein